MRIRTVAGVLSTLAFLGFLFVLAGPAAAASPCPAGQPPGDIPGRSPSQQPDDGRPDGYPPGRCQLLLSQQSAAAGESVTASGSGYGAGSPVRVTFDGATVATATADGGGGFSAPFTVPSSAQPGSHRVAGSGVDDNGETYVLSATLDVTAEAGEAGAPSSAGGAQEGPGGTLPRTGDDNSVPIARVGAMLVLVGACFVIMARRRTQAGT